ncbi:hypothetical protein CBL_00993 [Carabus blaptoides fortunei]
MAETSTRSLIPENLEVKFDDTDESLDLRDSRTIPFQVEWCFGVDVCTKVFNLTRNKDYRKIFCSVSHAAMIYDHRQHDMRFLLGHSNYISCISSDLSGRWLVTAGSADDNTVIVWDADGCFPVNTIFEPHQDGGVRFACMSPDAKYLVTIGAEAQPNIKFWQWTLGKETPDDCYIVQHVDGSVVDVCFSKSSSNQFMLTFATTVLFFTWRDDKLVMTEPRMNGKCTSDYGNFTMSTYMEQAHECLTASDTGHIAMWGPSFVLQPFSIAPASDEKMFLKAIRVQKRHITSITSIDGVIATGDVQGNVKFYSHRIQLLYWCINFTLPPIQTISFNLEKRQYKMADTWPVEELKETNNEEELHSSEDEDRSDEYEQLYANIVPSDYSLQRSPFVVRDFLILGNNGLLGYVNFIDNTLELLLENTNTAITSLAIHDEQPVLCIGYASGTVCTYDYATRRLKVEQTITSGQDEHDAITSLTYSHQGLHLACGTTGGYLWFLQPATLQPQPDTPFFFAHSEIQSIRFSVDNNYLVYCDAAAGVCLLHRQLTEDNTRAEWQYQGRYIAHTRSITDILFADDYRLFTLSKDKHIVEYNVRGSGTGKLELVRRECIMQTGIPLSFFVYTIDDEEFFVISTSEYKYILVSTDTYVTDRTVLAPVLGMPVQRFTVIPCADLKYMMFTTDKYLGIQLLPVTGNPCEHVGMVGHPEYIGDYILSPDGKHAFTIGKQDNICLMWRLNINAADILAQRGGTDLKQYIRLIEGGLTGWLFQEMQDLFYYMQILHQGENSALPRKASSKLPVTELPNLMRAIGYYPTEYALDNMKYEVKKYYTTMSEDMHKENHEEEISFEDFVKLYINHRPSVGVALDQLQVAFHRFATGGQMKRETFVDVLCNNGEPFQPDALTHCLKVLMHQARRGNIQQEAKTPEELLPEVFDFSTFTNDIVGINMEQ